MLLVRNDGLLRFSTDLFRVLARVLRCRTSLDRILVFCHLSAKHFLGVWRKFDSQQNRKWKQQLGLLTVCSDGDTDLCMEHLDKIIQPVDSWKRSIRHRM